MIDATVVIPTYNRAQGLVATLEALVAANPEPGWEAVVVDDGSTDGTQDVLSAWIDAAGAPVRCVRQDNAGPAAARNAGAARACGTNLIFMDDDMIVSKDFVAAHLAALHENPGCWIVGRVTLPDELRGSPFGRYLHDRLEEFHRTHPSDRPSPTEGVTAQSLSIPADDFGALGGFDEDFTIASGEDWELGMRARQRGIGILYDPRIVSVHDDWATVDLNRFCRRQWMYSVSDVLLCQKYGRLSPRWSLVSANGPLRLGREPGMLSASKLAKSVLATRPGQFGIRLVSRVATREFPDSAVTRRTYDLAAAIAIFSGVRDGVQRYGDPTIGEQSGNRRTVCHLIDESMSTPYFDAIARHADHHRHPVMIGSIAAPGGLQAAMKSAGAPTFSLGASGRGQYPVALIRLVRFLRANRVAILHAHCFDPTLLGLVAARAAGARFVFTRHHSDHNIRMGKRWHTAVDSWCARHADHVIAVSEATRRILVEIEGAAAGLITVVYNGMEPMDAPSTDAVRACREALGLDPEVPVALVLARLHEEKGHEVLFDAMPSVTSTVGRVRWLLAGDGPHRARFEREVASRGLEDVQFLGQRSDIAELIALSTVVVQPSRAESFGFAALEAASLGRPVVASDAGGLPEVVLDGVTGLVVPRDDPEALAEALCRLLEDPQWAEELGRAGIERTQSFSAARMVREYEQVYDSLDAR